MSFIVIFEYYLFTEVKSNRYTLILADDKVAANSLIEVQTRPVYIGITRHFETI